MRFEKFSSPSETLHHLLPLEGNMSEEFSHLTIAQSSPPCCSQTHHMTFDPPAIFFFLLPWLILSFAPLSLNFPSLMAASALLIALFRALLQEFDTLFNLSKILPAQSKSGLRVWRNIVPDIETDRVFLVSRSVDK